MVFASDGAGVTIPSFSLSTTLSPDLSPSATTSSLIKMTFNLSLHESITSLVFLLVCGKGILKLATQFRQLIQETNQEDIELGNVGGVTANGDA